MSNNRMCRNIDSLLSVYFGNTLLSADVANWLACTDGMCQRDQRCYVMIGSIDEVIRESPSGTPFSPLTQQTIATLTSLFFYQRFISNFLLYSFLTTTR